MCIVYRLYTCKLKMLLYLKKTTKTYILFFRLTFCSSASIGHKLSSPVHGGGPDQWRRSDWYSAFTEKDVADIFILQILTDTATRGYKKLTLSTHLVKS